MIIKILELKLLIFVCVSPDNKLKFRIKIIKI